MRSLLFIVLLALVPLRLSAHGLVHDQISKLNHEIHHHPDQADLYLQRGRLYLEEAHDPEAQRDFERALQLDRNARAAHYFLGQLALKRDEPDLALRHAETFIASLQGERGGLTRGYRLLGDIYSHQHEFGRAADAYRAAIAQAESPQPEYFLDLADACLKQGAGHLDDAIAALDDGIRRLGPLTVLQDKAVEIESRAGRFDAALQRLDAMIAQGQRLPELYARQGRLLLAAGRTDAARESFQMALARLDSLPAARRETAAMRELRGTLQAQLSGT